MAKNKDLKKFAITVILTAVLVSAGTALGMNLFMEKQREAEIPLVVEIATDKAPFGVAPLTISFSAKVLNAKGKVFYRWDFGNGEVSRDKEVEVTYREPGMYLCKLEVRDEAGRKGESVLNVVVEKNRPPVVTLTINKVTVNRKFTILNILKYIPFWWYAGDQEEFIDWLAKRKGPWAWGESGIEITAHIDDPEGDEIIAYEWREQTEDELVKITGKSFVPVHNLTGNETVKIPALYAWIPHRHIVTLTVTDSAGNKVTVSTAYMVSESLLETRIKTWIQNLKSFYLGIKMIGDIMKLLRTIYNKLSNQSTSQSNLYTRLPFS